MDLYKGGALPAGIREKDPSNYGFKQMNKYNRISTKMSMGVLKEKTVV